MDTTKAKRGTSQVDTDFLGMLSDWRELLAKRIALRNEEVDVFQLNHAVQLIIDMIVFLRFAEAHDLEEYGTLIKSVEKRETYWELKGLFALADQKYNSGLFAIDDFINNLQIDNQVFKEIITRLYYPKCPYEFSVLPIDILGSAYEQFLGKTIRLTPRHQAKIDEKPDVRKAGGVYYTPEFVVRYIVENTVGEKIKGRTPTNLPSLAILDPACGSGSFLIGAYSFLLDWHLDYYSDKKHSKQALKEERIYQLSTDEYRLTIEEKQRILLNFIYGVDLDQQAVEVTRLSLLIRLMEGENRESADQLFKHSDFKLLPNLDTNIKCGNSLIGSEYYSENKNVLFKMEEIRRVNAFDWKKEFPAIMSSGGFDCVIGNPPYVRIQTMKEWAPFEVEEYKSHYQSARSGNYDLYVVFVEKGLSLLNPTGLLGYILPHKFFNAQYGERLRRIISTGKYLRHVVHFSDQQIFADATTYTCLMLLDKAGVEKCRFTKVESLAAWIRNGTAVEGDIPLKALSGSKWTFITGRGGKLFEKLLCMPNSLGDVASRMAQGIRTSANDVYVLDLVSTKGNYVIAHSKILDKEVRLENASIRNFLQGREIRPFHVEPSGKIVIIPYHVRKGRSILIPERELESKYPSTYAYLKTNKGYLAEREHGRMHGEKWYGYVYPKNIDIMHAPKILVPDIANCASFAFDCNGEYAFTSGYGVTLKQTIRMSPAYLLGLLNSPVLDYFLKQVSTTMRGGYFRYFTQYIEQIPIWIIDFEETAQRKVHDELVQLIEGMVQNYKELVEKVRTQHDKKLIEDRIEVLQAHANQIIYKLYGLTIGEINIVECK